MNQQRRLLATGLGNAARDLTDASSMGRGSMGTARYRGCGGLGAAGVASIRFPCVAHSSLGVHQACLWLRSKPVCRMGKPRWARCTRRSGSTLAKALRRVLVGARTVATFGGSQGVFAETLLRLAGAARRHRGRPDAGTHCAYRHRPLAARLGSIGDGRDARRRHSAQRSNRVARPLGTRIAVWQRTAGRRAMPTQPHFVKGSRPTRRGNRQGRQASSGPAQRAVGGVARSVAVWWQRRVRRSEPARAVRPRSGGIGREPARQPPRRARRVQDSGSLCGQANTSPRAATHLCHTSARWRCRFARSTRVAWSPTARDDADLHPRKQGASKSGVRVGASARLATRLATAGAWAATFSVALVAVLAAESSPVAAQVLPERTDPELNPEVNYIWPVQGTVVDPFRPPAKRWGSGNRGLEFATQPGSAFWAAERGVVSFAGPVGGRLHVTVTHPDGLRVSYSGVASMSVRRGDRVRQGQSLGTTDSRLHVGVRRGDTYLDPALIFGRARQTNSSPVRERVRLVPTSLPVYRLQLRWLQSAAGTAVF